MSAATIGGQITAIEPGSAAQAAGLEPGDRLVALDGHSLHDIIDYRFYLEPGIQEVQFTRADQWMSTTMDNGPGIDPGIEFGAAVFDRIRTCRCHCVFCFVEQLPPGLRRSLYLRDDDYRLSFLYGNFITLNNLREEDVQRIEEQRLSPLYVSVHATDPEVRGPIMGCDPDQAAAGLQKLKDLGDAGIHFHVQIVLCPGINDRFILADTVAALAGDEYAGIDSIGIVPVAVSPDHLMHHAGLSEPGEAGPPPLRPVTGEDCRGVVEQVQAWQERYRRAGRLGLVYAADEFYLRGGVALPPVADYDDFAQFENGVGIASSFMAEAADTVRAALEETDNPLPARLFLLTGTLAAGLMSEVCRVMADQFGMDIEPLVVENRIFGPHVTVAGLLGGRDIKRDVAAAGLDENDLLLIPAACLDSSAEPRFLDDLTLMELREALPCSIWTP